MTGQAAIDALTRLPGARATWLSTATTMLSSRPFVTAVWLEGSLGAGVADAFSDIDLVVAVDESAPPEVFADPPSGLGLPGRLLYVRDKPKNAPTGGAYRAVCVELMTLPVLVDLYLWPTATATMSATAQLLYQRGDERPPRSDLGFLPLISQYPSGDTRDSDPYQPQTVLMLVQLAAKHVARGDHERHAKILRQLQVRPADIGTALLRSILAARVDPTAHPQLQGAVAAVQRLINVAEHTASTPGPATSALQGEIRWPGHLRGETGSR